MLLFPVAGSSLLAVVGVTTAKSAEGNICLHLSCFHTTSSMNPSSVTAQDKTLTFPQSSWWSSSSPASVLGMVIQSTRQWIRDFHLSYWPCSSDAQHPEMKKKNQRKFCAADSVICTWNQFKSRKACRDHIPHKEHCWVMAWYWTSWGFWEIAIQIQCLTGRCGCDKVQVREMMCRSP